MRAPISRSPRQLAFRHWLLTTAIGFALSIAYVSYLSYWRNQHNEPLLLASIITLAGGALGRLGVWWVRLLLEWAAPTAHPKRRVGLGLLLTYAAGFAATYFLSDIRQGGSWAILLVLPVWCAASLLALRLLPPEQAA